MSEQSFRWKLRDQRDELLDVLRQWAWAEAHGDNAELTNARKARDAAIARAEGQDEQP